MYALHDSYQGTFENLIWTRVRKSTRQPSNSLWKRDSEVEWQIGQNTENKWYGNGRGHCK